MSFRQFWWANVLSRREEKAMFKVSECFEWHFCLHFVQLWEAKKKPQKSEIFSWKYIARVQKELYFCVDFAQLWALDGNSCLLDRQNRKRNPKIQLFWAAMKLEPERIKMGKEHTQEHPQRTKDISGSGSLCRRSKYGSSVQKAFYFTRSYRYLVCIGSGSEVLYFSTNTHTIAQWMYVLPGCFVCVNTRVLHFCFFMWNLFEVWARRFLPVSAKRLCKGSRNCIFHDTLQEQVFKLQAQLDLETQMSESRIAFNNKASRVKILSGDFCAFFVFAQQRHVFQGQNN